MQLARHGVEERARVGEAHLGLLRVHVDVDLGRAGLRRRRRRPDSAPARAPSRRPARRRARAARSRTGRPLTSRCSPPAPARARSGGARCASSCIGPALARARLEPLARVERLRRPLAARRGAEPLARRAAVAHEEEADVGPRERREQQRLADVRRLRPRRLQELAARGDVEEEVADLDARSLGGARRPRPRRRRRPRAATSIALARAARARRRAAASRPTRCSAAPRRGSRTCVSAKRSSFARILLVAWRSSASTRVVLVHARAVVGHANERRAAPLELHLDARGPRVERVLDELLDDARGALDHLAGGDLVREVGRQRLDAAHRGASAPSALRSRARRRRASAAG